ncbi:NAD(P)H-dependent flavin oxidoreductase [Blautia sp. HCP3S3_G3]|uniref:NAD(P)H-dependent flavin oxidoreductase n=1 Tax=Blautia sp. HCP3S3_G3 TaxID=3438913 RepID=UPI003F8B1470
MKSLVIGNKTARIPVIQGGMGVGVSLSGLAGAVAASGGVGVISAAQIGFEEPDFYTNCHEANLRALKKHIKKAKEQAKDGLVGVNIMVATKEYAAQVHAACEAGADLIISGAGLPAELPELVKGYEEQTKIAPIVSSVKSARVILKLWDRHHHRTADMVVIEGPKAGGHLGFSRDQLDTITTEEYDREIQEIIAVVKEYGEKYGCTIPVVAAGGIFDRQDILHALELGADGVQMATRFVVTEECDASLAFKQAYLDADASSIEIIKSPVGMPGRAVHNTFLEKVARGQVPVKRCLSCLSACNPAKAPYCITQALIAAVQGDTENGLIFCGSNASRLKQLTTVPELMKELTEELPTA